MELFHNLDGDNTTALVVGIIALIGVVLNVFFTVFTNNKSTYINIVTSNRLEWIKQFKIMINEFTILIDSETGLIYKKISKNDFEYYQNLISAKNKIIFHLNYLGNLDNEIISRLNKITKSYERLVKVVRKFEDELEIIKDESLQSKINDYLSTKFKLYDIDIISKEIVMYTQVYLKFEWERVKRETRIIYIKMPNFYLNYKIKKNIKKFKKINDDIKKN